MLLSVWENPCNLDFFPNSENVLRRLGSCWKMKMFSNEYYTISSVNKWSTHWATRNCCAWGDSPAGQVWWKSKWGCVAGVWGAVRFEAKHMLAWQQTEMLTTYDRCCWGMVRVGLWHKGSQKMFETIFLISSKDVLLGLGGGHVMTGFLTCQLCVYKACGKGLHIISTALCMC